MADRDSWAVGATGDRRVGAEDARLGVGLLTLPGATAITARGGLRPGPGDPGKVAATGTPGANVTVNAAQMVINASRGYGPYLATSDAQKSVPILDVPAHASNTRHDLIVAQQSDADYADANRGFWVGRILGIPAASPADPAVTTGNGAPTNSPDYLVLARVRVTALAATITNAMIDDLRPPWIAALGGVVLVKTQAERDAMTTWAGLTIYRLDRKWTEQHDGTAWRVQGVAVCSSTADRDSAVTHPTAGTMAITTDTDTVWTYDVSSWIPVGGATYPRGLVGAPTVQTSNSASWGATEAVGASVTVTIPYSGRRWWVRFNSGWSASALSTHEFRLRWKAGATVDTSGTQFHVKKYRVHTSGAFDRIVVEGYTTTALAAGQHTFVVTGRTADAATGQLLGASDNERLITITDMGN